MTSDNERLNCLDDKDKESSNYSLQALKWLNSIEYFSDDSRVTQGKNLALKGQVSDLIIEPGKVDAKVQGDKIKPYSVRLEFTIFSESLWEKVLEELSQKAVYQAKILNGEIPLEIETICQKENSSLFPLLKNDLRAGCNCPDWAIPCKHIAAVYYLLADMINNDPMVLFRIRGKTRNEVVEIINQKRIKNFIHENKSTNKTTTDDIVENNNINDNFWLMKNNQVNLSDTEQQNSLDITKILAESPFVLSNVNLSTLIRNSYETAKQVAQKKNK